MDSAREKAVRLGDIVKVNGARAAVWPLVARASWLSNGGCMAILIPSLGFARFDTRGELRLAERLRTSSKKTLSFGTTSR